jgi:hypothetical protein
VQESFLTAASRICAANAHISKGDPVQSRSDKTTVSHILCIGDWLAIVLVVNLQLCDRAVFGALYAVILLRVRVVVDGGTRHGGPLKRS